MNDPGLVGVLHGLGRVDHHPGDGAEIFGGEDELAVFFWLRRVGGQTGGGSIIKTVVDVESSGGFG